MKKSDWQYLVDTLLFICIVSIIFIGFLMGLFLPKGPTAPESSKYFLGLHRHDWGDIHFYLSIAFTGLVIIHLILSWNWIRGKTKQLFKKRWNTALTLTALISISVLVLIWIFWPKYSETYADYGKGAGRKARDTITELLSIETESLEQKKERAKPLAIKEEEKFTPVIKEEKHEGEEEHEKKLTRGRMEEDKSGILITGRMTLYDIEKETGIPARKIVEKLGIPPSAPLDETLGRLRKRYLFTMQELRDVVSFLMEKK